jgi:hypothetical protein
MKTKSFSIYNRNSTSSIGSAPVDSTAKPDSMASVIRDCTLILEPAILESHQIQVVQNTFFHREGFSSREASKIWG